MDELSYGRSRVFETTEGMGLKAAYLTAVVAAVGAVTAIDFRVFHVNSATAGFTFLVLILGLATRAGLREAITASIVSMAAYNFFFLPPVGRFTIADPQNWVALFAFLATAITASQLSSSARKKAEEARRRQQELQRMYDFSRSLMLGDEEHSLADQITRQIAEAFDVESAWYYDSATGKISKADGEETALEESRFEQVASSGRRWRNARGTALIVPVQLGKASLGSLGVAGGTVLPEVAMQAVAQLVAIAIERARSQEAANRVEATRQNEQLKSTLLDALAHEFKTPLTSVKAATSTLLASDGLNASDQRDLITVVDEEADRMTKLVSDSIELARMGTAPLTLHSEPVAPAELVTSAMQGLKALLDGREVSLAIAEGLPLVWADRQLSELALRQVLNNALKYSPASAPIEVRADESKEFVVIRVLDRGPGIPKADAERVFQKFYRGPNVRDRVAGTGLGLSIAREIVEAQGGRIWVESEAGRGATFSLSLPEARRLRSYEGQDFDRGRRAADSPGDENGAQFGGL